MFHRETALAVLLPYTELGENGAEHILVRDLASDGAELVERVSEVERERVAAPAEREGVPGAADGVERTREVLPVALVDDDWCGLGRGEVREHGLDERGIRRLLIGALVVLGLGLYAFVLRGADRPADPVLLPSAGTDGTLPDAVEPPGPADRVPLEGFDEVAVVVQPEDGSDLLAWCLLAALAAEQRARGLMEVTDLQGYAGMAFLYDEPVANAFHMSNTPMPLSIAWIDEAGAVVSTTDMEPCLVDDGDRCPRYPPAGSYVTAIEVPQGELAALGITDGARVTVGGSCAPRA